MKIEKKTFDEGERLSIRDEYVDCVFARCTLVFDGTAVPHFTNCHFKGGHVWFFDGPAAETLRFIQSLYGIGETQMVEDIFSQIREGRIPKAPPIN